MQAAGSPHTVPAALKAFTGQTEDCPVHTASLPQGPGADLAAAAAAANSIGHTVGRIDERITAGAEPDWPSNQAAAAAATSNSGWLAVQRISACMLQRVSLWHCGQHAPALNSSPADSSLAAQLALIVTTGHACTAGLQAAADTATALGFAATHRIVLVLMPAH